MQALLAIVASFALVASALVWENSNIRAGEAWRCGRYADAVACSAGGPDSYAVR